MIPLRSVVVNKNIVIICITFLVIVCAKYFLDIKGGVIYNIAWWLKQFLLDYVLLKGRLLKWLFLLKA